MPSYNSEFPSDSMGRGEPKQNQVVLLTCDDRFWDSGRPSWLKYIGKEREECRRKAPEIVHACEDIAEARERTPREESME